MMSKHGVCCDKCLHSIAKHSTNAAKLWLDICEIHMKVNGVFSIGARDFEELQMLEHMGFIVTTETSNSIFLKVLGHSVAKDTDNQLYTFFCINNCDEDN